MTIIKYNGQNLPHPLPVVSREEGIAFVGERWAIRETYRLNGQIIGCDGFQALLNSGLSIVNLFNKDFQDFVVEENSIEIVRKSGVIVESISFENSNYAGAVPYTVVLSCYPSLLQNVFGVLEPVDEWTFDEQQNGIVRINHNVGATAYGNFQNAINFVQARTGYQQRPAPQFLNLTGNFVLEAQEETIDRFNGSYNIAETYLVDSRSSGLISRYTFSLESGLEGFISVAAQGNVDGGLNTSIVDLRNTYNNLGIVSKIQNYYNLATDLNDLNTTPLNSGIVEDTFNKKLSFNLNFDNNPDPIVSLDRTVSISSGDETTRVSVNGRIFGRGEQASRWSKVQAYFNTVNIYGMAQSGYNYYGGSYTVNPRPLSSGTVINQFSSDISFNVEFDDRDAPPFGFLQFNPEVSFTPAVRKIVARQLAAHENPDESFYVVDLGFYPKVRMTIRGGAILNENIPISVGKNLLIDEITRLFYLYAGENSVLEAKEISSNPDFGREFSFNFSWIMDNEKKVNYEPRFDIVADLNIK